VIVCAAALVVAFAACFWQKPHAAEVANNALPKAPKTSANHLNGVTQDLVSLHTGLSTAVKGVAGLVGSSASPLRVPIGDRQLLRVRLGQRP